MLWGTCLAMFVGKYRKIIIKKIKSSSLPQKDDIISDLSGDEWDETQETEEWTNAIDRGGLWHISDSTYSIFYLMEEEIRKHLMADTAKTLNAETKK